jgi:hypothetical protein
MRVGIIQSAYMPWRGYFDFINSVDLFVIYDDVLYSRGSWRNRNQIKTSNGLKWLTVPVQSDAHHFAIDQIRIASPLKPWQPEHERQLVQFLGKAPYFADAFSLWQEALEHSNGFLSQLNQSIIVSVCQYLCIQTKILQSRDFNLHGAKTERLIELLTKLNATCYVSGPAARGYLDESMFLQKGIRLEYKSYDYKPYPQLWGEFQGAVSILDLIANCGHEAKNYLQSATPNVVAVV